MSIHSNNFVKAIQKILFGRFHCIKYKRRSIINYVVGSPVLSFFCLKKKHKKTPPEPDYADMELIFLTESSSVSSAWSITWSFAGVSGNVAVSGIS